MNIKQIYIFSLLLAIFSVSGATFFEKFSNLLRKKEQTEIQDKTHLDTNCKVAIIYVPENLDFKQLTLNLVGAVKDKEIKGIILMISNFGGSFGAYSAIHDLIKKITEIKPVIALISDGACSCGYLIASPANYIIAHRGSSIGHIGLYSQICKYKNPKQKGEVQADMNFEIFQAGEYKMLYNSYSKDLTEEQKKYVQERLDKDYEVFLNMVSENRKLDLAKCKDWADGKIFNGHDALALGLIDEIGTILDAEKKIIELAMPNADNKHQIEVSPVFYPEKSPDDASKK